MGNLVATKRASSFGTDSQLGASFFFTGVFVGPLFISMYALDPPGRDSSQAVLDPRKSYAAKVFVLTTLANVALTTLAMWVNVLVAAKNNSFSKNKEDWNTGDNSI